jgi:hypothetical protein
MAEIALGDGPVAAEAARVLMAFAFGIPAQEVGGEEQKYGPRRRTSNDPIIV